MNLRRLLCRIGIHGPVAYRYEPAYLVMSAPIKTEPAPLTSDFKPEPIMDVGWDVPVCSLCGRSMAKESDSRLIESMAPPHWKKITHER